MAVGFDAVGPGSSGQFSASNSVTWSHTCSGSNRVVYVGVALGLSPDTGVTTTATYNGTSMTSLSKIHSTGGSTGYVELFRLINPPTGSSTVLVSASSSANLIAGSVSVTGAHQTSPEATPVTTASAGSQISINMSSQTGNFLLALMAGAKAFGTSPNTTQWLNNHDLTTGAGNAAMITDAGAASVTMSYTMPGLPSAYSGIGVDIQQAGSAMATAPWISAV